MAKSIYQKFLDFKARNELSNEEITQIATEYANSHLELARSYFADKYKISEHTFYKARDFAIIFCLVDKETYERIKQKSSTNQKNNINNPKKNAASSIAYFDELLVKQQEFLDGFSNNEILDIAHKYVEGMSVENIAKAYDTGPFAINYLLKKGIIMLIFDSNIVNQISVIAKGSLENILQKRKANKQFLLDCYQSEILFLNLQIKNYDLYFRNCSKPPTLESLKEKLSNATKMYHEALQL